MSRVPGLPALLPRARELPHVDALGADPLVLFEISFTASVAGSMVFTADPADVSPEHDSLLFGIDQPLDASDIEFSNTTIEIVPAMSATTDEDHVLEIRPGRLAESSDDTSEFGATVIRNTDGTLTYDPRGADSLQRLDRPGR